MQDGVLSRTFSVLIAFKASNATSNEHDVNKRPMKDSVANDFSYFPQGLYSAEDMR